MGNLADLMRSYADILEDQNSKLDEGVCPDCNCDPCECKADLEESEESDAE